MQSARRPASTRSWPRSAPAGGEAIGMPCDVLEESSVKALVAQTRRALRPARRDGQQRRHRLPDEAAGRDGAVELGCRARRQPARRVLRHQARGDPDDRAAAGRPDHQHRQPGLEVRLPVRGALRRVEAWRRRPHAHRGDRARAAPHHGQHHLPEPRHHRPRRLAEQVLQRGHGPQRGDLPGGHARQNPAGPAGPAGRTSPRPARSSLRAKRTTSPARR